MMKIEFQPSFWLFTTYVYFLSKLICHGNVQIQYRDLWKHPLGDGVGHLYKLRIESLWLIPSLLIRGELGFGEGYMDKRWYLEGNDLSGFIGLLLQNEEVFLERTTVKFINKCRRLLANEHPRNNPNSSRRNVAHHYDIGNDLYQSFLDEGLNYSCAFFSDSSQSLRQAQLNKLHVSVERLLIGPGMSVIDIGCGWGELTRVISAETQAANVVGITLSNEQATLADGLVPDEAHNRLSYLLEDYRTHCATHNGEYDRVISIGMFEHVGKQHFVTFFETVRDLLKVDGRALIHTIIRPNMGSTSPFIDKYIFPGGYIPSLEEVLSSVEKSGMVVDTEPYLHDGTNYARTLQYWRQRFNSAFKSMEGDRYNDRFWRMWNFYLASSEAAFNSIGFSVAQIPLKKTRKNPQKFCPVSEG